MILTLVPPVPGPLDGLTEEMVGALSTTVQVKLVEPENPSWSVAVTVTE